MKKKVLVIDDNPHILEAVELILTTEDYDVHSRTNITDIVSYTTKLHPSVILLDLLLSGKSGQDAATLLKKDNNTKDIPIIIISAHPSAESAAKKVGADGFLAKPFDIADLLTLVEKYSSTTQ